jgi:hypothetical protein
MSASVIWSNAANGQTGSIAYTGATNSSGWAWSQVVTLADGPNILTFSANYPTAGPPVQTGFDSASNYTGWTSGSTGGTGFGPWGMSTSGAAGHFLATTSNHSNLTVNATKGFGLYANSGGLVTARRNLPSAMEVGDVFTLRMDNNWIDSGGRVGVALAVAGGSNRMSFYFIGGGSTYRIDDAATNRDSGTAYTGDGLLLTFTLTGSDTYSLSTGANVISGTLGGSAPITQLVASNSNAGPNTERNFYLGEMTFTEHLSTSAAVSAAAPAVTMQASGQTDGLPDSWWTQYAVPPDERVAAADRDSDGFTNAQEHALGTDPTSRASTFRVTSIRNDGSTTTVEWSAVAGKKYRLQATADLSGSSWVDVGAEVTAVQGADSASAGHSAAGSHFYRVRLVDP